MKLHFGELSYQFFLFQYLIFVATMGDKDNQYLENSICSDSTLINFIQKNQIKKAKDHIITGYSKVNEFNSSTDDDISNLFSHHFETLEADISDISVKTYETLAYYR